MEERQQEYREKLQGICDLLTQTENRLIGHQEAFMIGDGTAELKKYQSKQEVESSFALVGWVDVKTDYKYLESSSGYWKVVIILAFRRQGAPKTPPDLSLKLYTKNHTSSSNKPRNFPGFFFFRETSSGGDIKEIW